MPLGRRFNPTAADAWELRVGQMVMDLRAHTARRGDTALDLTKTEWTLLEYLMRPSRAGADPAEYPGLCLVV